MVRPRANAGLTESMRGPRRRQHRRARAKEREAYVADTISSSSDDQSRHCPASSPMTASLFAALPIRPHILLPHVRACRTCLTTHPSYALITANTASQRFGLDALALQELARSSPPGDSHVRLFQVRTLRRIRPSSWLFKVHRLRQMGRCSRRHFTSPADPARASTHRPRTFTVCVSGNTLRGNFPRREPPQLSDGGNPSLRPHFLRHFQAHAAACARTLEVTGLR